MGFKSGNILEPSMGVGNFIGNLPDEMNKSKFYGVELDSVSGRIAKPSSSKFPPCPPRSCTVSSPIASALSRRKSCSGKFTPTASPPRAQPDLSFKKIL